MPSNRFAASFAAALFALPLAAQSPQPSPQPAPSSLPAKSMKLDIVVESKSGQPLTTLQQQDFTVVDNKTQRPITSFKIESPKDEPVEVIVYLDAVNTSYDLLAQVRKGVDKYFKENSGALGYPTTFAILTDDGARFNKRFSSDGLKLSDDLEHDQIGFRQIIPSSQWGENERLEIATKAMHQLLILASNLPGRKIVLFISPGFPLLSGPGVQIWGKAQQSIFNEVIYLSTQLRQRNVSLYTIDPIGVSEPMFGANYYASFLKGLTGPRDAQPADLSLQVLSVQSGGLTLLSSNDIPGMIHRCLLDAASWYQVSFDPLPSDKANEYHHLEVRTDQPHTVVRTRDGYYANPTPVIAK